MIPEQRTLDHIPVTQVLHALPEPAWMVTPDGREYVYNRKLSETFPVVERSREEQQSVLHPEDRMVLTEAFEQGLQTDREFSLTFRVMQESHAYQWYRVQVSPVMDQSRVVAWLGVIRALDDGHEVLQALIEHVPVGMALMDLNYQMKLVNPRLIEGTRYSRSEYENAHLQKLFPDTYQHVKPLIDQVIATEEALPPVEFEGRHAPEGQKPPHWQVTYFPVKSRDGRLIGVGSTTQDVTSRKMAEQELKENQEFLRRITEAVPAVIGLRDLKTGKTVFSNNYAAQVIGYTLQELEGMGEAEVVKLFPPEDLPATYQHYQSVPLLAEGEVIEREYRMKHRDGTWRWIYGKTTIFSRDAQGQALTALSASLDITDRKAIEEALRHSEQQLLRVMEAQKRFVSEASHEIKTPLAGIQGNLEVLLRFKDIPEEEKLEILQDCHREATRLGRLVTDLLGMAKGNADLPMIEDDVRLDQLVQDTFRELERTRGRRQMLLGQLDSCLVLGDPDRLKQLLVILVSNAIKYTPDGGTVTVHLLSGEKHIELRVEDTGIGIGEEDLKHVFDRFYRADNTAQGMTDPGGTGLGLNIARWIVEEHQGQIRLESQPGVGTTAIVTFPLLK
ncbi:PAS domain S-box protein [Deinococcus cellulosilyticus]|uniref:histidine kinase n=1 Tax=Deinococcus cellulosilyticus (strain DSM 18568 / NBRC 106333 / KACC 11606 / 5516J-15) TaxID=1223518 RepID=A0A511N600_DEIC1|nr:PAS domain S-box protein [Deinococcus cellulosilyticus]GEM47831.1 hypothetical protein DC3_34660 [Deinococcus cellulosilyticus NBRC 106333 = KACC 11606]